MGGTELRRAGVLRRACVSLDTSRNRAIGKTPSTHYDVAEHLRTPKEMAAHLEICLEEADGDVASVANVLGDLVRATVRTQVARDAGFSREGLSKALSGERTPNVDTILKVIGALGLKLHAEVRQG